MPLLGEVSATDLLKTVKKALRFRPVEAVGVRLPREIELSLGLLHLPEPREREAEVVADDTVLVGGRERAEA